MELHEAHEVKEVYSPREATDAIQQDDWKLLAVATTTNPKNQNAVCVCYVLGKPKKAAGYIPTVGAAQMNVRD